MRFRTINKARARWGGYFWIPCPLCGKEFGGHEWKSYNGLPLSIPHDDGRPGHGKAICPDCVKAGEGYYEGFMIFNFNLD